MPARSDLGPGGNAGQFLYRRQVASGIHHRNILATLDIGEDQGKPYVVLEHFAGETLTSIIEQESPFDVDDVAILTEQIAQGLAHAHTRGIVHGALSPDSIIIDSSGLAKIVDMGMIEGQMLSESGSRANLLADPYLPANLRGSSLVTHALDVHALASIAWQMLVGVPPPPGDIPRSPAAINPAVPERAGEVVYQGLSAYGASTGLSAMQFSHALTNWRSFPVGSTDNNRPPKSPGTPRVRDQPAPVYIERWPAPHQEARRDAPSAPVPHPERMSDSNRAARSLALLATLLAVITFVVLFRADVPDAVGIGEIPSELSELLNVTGE